MGLRTQLRRIVDQWKDRETMIAPPSMDFVGGGAFEEVGKEFKRHFIELAGLKPDWRVLDVGCGIGRMAVPLTDYLSPEGEYWGFDIVKMGIKWCQNRITPKFPNFQFRHSNVYNRHYNPKGRIQPREYQFPFQDGYFDFVFLTSVFTHMLPPDLERYVSEISRVLKPGATCLATFFLLNPESKELLRAGRSTQNFAYDLAGDTSGAGCRIVDQIVPEAAIAFEEDYVGKLYTRHQLKITTPIHYGFWCKRPKFLSCQDIVIATRTAGV